MMQPPQYQQQPPVAISTKTSLGVVFLVLGFILLMTGACTFWMLGLGLIPIMLSIPFFVVAIILLI